MVSKFDVPKYRNPRGSDYYDMIEKAAKGETIQKDNMLYKALGIDSTNTGAEFIPEEWSAEIIFEIYENSWARQLFQTRVIKDGVKMNIPKFTTKLVEASAVSSPIDALPTELTSGTSIENATMATDEVELELKTLSASLVLMNKWVAYNVDSNIEADLKQEFTNAMAEAEEDLLVNGDTQSSSASNINYTYNDSSNITGVNSATGDNEHLLLFDGIRKSAGAADVDAGGGTWDETDFTTGIRNLGVFARKGRDKLVILISPDLYASMLTWEVVETIDKYGPNATIISGEVFKIYGIRVVVTNKMPCTERSSKTSSTGARAASANDFVEWAMVMIDTVIIGATNKASRMFNIVKDDQPKFDRQELIAIEDFGFAFKWTTAMVRGINGLA